MESTKEHLKPEIRRRWRLVAQVAAVINGLLAVIDLGLSGGSGIPAVYLVSVVLLLNSVILFIGAGLLKES